MQTPRKRGRERQSSKLQRMAAAMANAPAPASNAIYCDHPGCGKQLHTEGNLNHALIKKALGGKTYCDDHLPALGRAMVGAVKRSPLTR